MIFLRWGTKSIGHCNLGRAGTGYLYLTLTFGPQPQVHRAVFIFSTAKHTTRRAFVEWIPSVKLIIWADNEGYRQYHQYKWQVLLSLWQTNINLVGELLTPAKLTLSPTTQKPSDSRCTIISRFRSHWKNSSKGVPYLLPNRRRDWSVQSSSSPLL